MTVVVVATALSLVVAFAVANLAYPQTGRPERTDVVLVLGPATNDRIALAESLMKKGLSSNLLVSVGSSKATSDPDTICSKKVSYTVYCAVPDPFTTQGEARWLGRMAREHGWKSATVITFKPHISRARIIVQRCFDGELDMLAVTTPLSLIDWMYQFAYQNTAYVKVALTPGC
ncbi:hypothetical protein KPL76_11755 [Subtercola sp. PAMC28395]|uniref:YdcF family protein n=1 Tax=Subtercola sp. PAMC28395 TaxID=2846775 RepID=UPI001C0BE0DC|nr:hypothetical protein [Subtercola sp. PAMC28395]QWT23388.1 hypothetical protein KPL76_11755 [Subtercola sp. PAMC28395]